MILIVGATGLLGGEICRLLTEDGMRVRALVRGTADEAKVARLKSLGVDLAGGDLKSRRSLEAACVGVHVVISTASSTLSRQEGDSIESVDHHGQLNLIEAAEAAGVKHFILVSFPPSPMESPLQSAKRDAEDRLRRSRMTHTILQPTVFMEVWLSPALGFDLAGAKARIFGTGQNAISWVSFQDVAKFAVEAIDNPRAVNTTVEIGGPEGLSPLDVVRMAEEIAGKPFAVEHVPEEALRAQYSAATDALQRSFAALMITSAAGGVLDPARALSILPVDNLKTVRQFLTASAAARAV
jgi:uncharacterized protein YbjT (DUF2867 family)